MSQGRKHIGNALVKILLSVISLAIALVPVWFYLLIRYLFSPEGYWQNLILFGLFTWFLGFLQMVLLILWIVALGVIWDD
ncbi:MAG: hypothetical protein Q7R91_01075 [bacterium]|nr:hypothetical protein [bacterium]